MKEYIKKFANADAANNYPITDIPFTTSIAADSILNLVCSRENKKIAIDGQGKASIVDATPTFTVNVDYYYNESGEDYQNGYVIYKCEFEPGMTLGKWLNSEYNSSNHCTLINAEYVLNIYEPDIEPARAIFPTELEKSINGEEFWWKSTPDSSWGQRLPATTILQKDTTYYYISWTWCLLGDTEVTMADGSTKQIKDIVVGDEVLSLDLRTREEVVRKVIYTDADENKSTTIWDEWEFSDGTILKTAHRHEFFNVEANRFKYMDEWQIGEHTLKQDGTTPALIKHTIHEEVVNHYKITLEGSNNYFANGCLTGDRYCNELL